VGTRWGCSTGILRKERVGWKRRTPARGHPPLPPYPCPYKSRIRLLALAGGVAGLAVEVVEVFGLDEVEAGFVDACEQPGDLGMCDGSFVASHEAAAPVVGAEGFGHTARPDLRAAIGNHRQFQAVAAHLFEGLAE